MTEQAHTGGDMASVKRGGMGKKALRRSDFDAVTFDVFGTLLDWEPEIASFFRAWAARNGLAVSDRDILGAYDRLRQPLQDLRPALRYPEVLKRTFDALAAEFGGRVERARPDAGCPDKH